jgi:exopolyphosphatase/pppGpp-phosphohydrolase
VTKEGKLFEYSESVIYSHDLESSDDNSLSNEILNSGFETLQRFVELKKQHCNGDFPIIGIATACFRKAINGLFFVFEIEIQKDSRLPMLGNNFINRICKELPIQLKIVDQETEGRIGFLTACAALSIKQNLKLGNDVLKRSVIAFDQGGKFIFVSRILCECLKIL